MTTTSSGMPMPNPAGRKMTTKAAASGREEPDMPGMPEEKMPGHIEPMPVHGRIHSVHSKTLNANKKK